MTTELDHLVLPVADPMASARFPRTCSASSMRDAWGDAFIGDQIVASFGPKRVDMIRSTP
jgi:hypothetical protein